MNRFTNPLFYLVGIIALASCSAGKNADNMKYELSGNWFIKSTLEVADDGDLVSTGKFIQDKWYPTSVPSTVLNALVKNGIYPDPRNGMNDFLIPDVSDEFNAKRDLAKYSYLPGKQNPWKDPYWYRTEFKLPSSFDGKQLWLNFNQINYRADVWLNGHKIADHKEMAGMFLRFKFNITSYANTKGNNYLAVKIYQVDHPGIPDPGTQFEVFGHNRGHAWEIFRDETLKFTGGWDCAPVIRDRNMGICQQVFINATGSVSFDDPYVITDLPLPDTSKADIKIYASLHNTGTSEIVGEINGTIDLISTLEFPTYKKVLGGSMPQIAVKKEVKLEPGETTTIEFNSTEFPQLLIQNPYLWWPNGYGKQYLHKLKLSFTINHEVSDAMEVTFGIREVTNEVKKIGKEYGRIFYVNGRRIFCRGGWIQPDMLLETNTKRLYDEARLCAAANVNMLGNEDAPSPADEIMETYDKYGLMVWETFFQCYRTYPGTASANNPDDHDLAKREVIDIVKRYRNNPSLVIWCLENEATVCEELYFPLRKSIIDLDSTRPFIPCTSFDWDVDKLTPYIKGDLPMGTTDDGDPDYNWNPESFYFNKVLEVNKQTFRNELGSPSMPTYSSLRKFIPTLEIQKSSALFPLDSIWAEHGAWDDNGYAYKAYDNAIRTIYGSPLNAEDYARKAQYVNANSYRAMFEAANHRMWDITSGVMIWKLNSCWPDVCWQVYDWYLNPNASYYFLQKALEPIHIQMNSNSRAVSIINTSMLPLSGLVIKAQLVDLDMKIRWARTDTVNTEPDRYKEFFSIPAISGLTSVYFVKLELMDRAGALISENLYWLCPQNPSNMSELGKIQPVLLNMEATSEQTEKEYSITVKLKNTSNKLSFFNRLMVTRGKGGEEVLPSFWSTNFMTLFPNEEKQVKVIIAREDLHGAKPFVCIEDSKADPVNVSK